MKTCNDWRIVPKHLYRGLKIVEISSCIEVAIFFQNCESLEPASVGITIGTERKNLRENNNYSP